MKPDIQNIIKAFRQLGTICHPDDWTQVKVEEITALCDEIERRTHKFEIGETVNVKMDSDYEQMKGVIIAIIESKHAVKRYYVFAEMYCHNTQSWFDEDQLCKQQTPA